MGLRESPLRIPHGQGPYIARRSVREAWLFSFFFPKLAQKTSHNSPGATVNATAARSTVSDLSHHRVIRQLPTPQQHELIHLHETGESLKSSRVLRSVRKQRQLCWWACQRRADKGQDQIGPTDRLRSRSAGQRLLTITDRSALGPPM